MNRIWGLLAGVVQTWWFVTSVRDMLQIFGHILVLVQMANEIQLESVNEGYINNGLLNHGKKKAYKALTKNQVD
jgi:hypothetical protein